MLNAAKEPAMTLYCIFCEYDDDTHRKPKAERAKLPRVEFAQCHPADCVGFTRKAHSWMRTSEQPICVPAEATRLGTS